VRGLDGHEEGEVVGQAACSRQKAWNASRSGASAVSRNRVNARASADRLKSMTGP